MGMARGAVMVTILELIDAHPSKIKSSVYGRLIFTAIHMSDRLLTQGNTNFNLIPPADLRRRRHEGYPIESF